MTAGIKTIIYPVKDLAAARALYGALLGVPPVMDEAYYVGFSVAGQDIGLDPHGHQQGLTGPVAYWHVADIERSLRALLDAGAAALGGVRDVGGGKLIASVKDADGNVIGLIQPARRRVRNRCNVIRSRWRAPGSCSTPAGMARDRRPERKRPLTGEQWAAAVGRRGRRPWAQSPMLRCYMVP